MGHPFFGERFVFRQPDGTEFEVRGWGDDTYAVFETLSGYTVCREPDTGEYVYAKLDQETGMLIASKLVVGSSAPEQAGLEKHIRETKGAQRAKRSQKILDEPFSDWRERSQRIAKRGFKSAMSAQMTESADSALVSVGQLRGLCIPIEFPDVRATFSQADITAFCNEAGYNGCGNNGSVRDYFHEVSGGRLDYQNIVTPVYRAKHSKEYYIDPKIDFTVRAQELIREAVSYFLAAGFDFSRVSTSRRGHALALNVFYAGATDSNYREGLWPHQSSLEEAYDVGPCTLLDYQITNTGAALKLGTFCHENGHLVCGFPDLYDTGRDSKGVGAYCLMGTGGVINEFNPVHPCAYLKFMAGWNGTLSALTDGRAEDLRYGENAFLFHTRSDDEYLMLEHRSAAGRDLSLPSSGLAIWHVDMRMENNDEQAGEPHAHYRCALIQADGQLDLEWNHNDGDDRDLFGSNGVSEYPNWSAGMTSNWWDGAPTGLRLLDIQSDESGSRFRVRIDSPGV